MFSKRVDPSHGAPATAVERRPYVRPLLVENPQQFQSLAKRLLMAQALPPKDSERPASEREPNAPPTKE